MKNLMIIMGVLFFALVILTSCGSGKNETETVEQATPAEAEETTPEATVTTTVEFDCDKFIKDYSAFADSYVKIVKMHKANPTASAVLIQYAEALEKAETLKADSKKCDQPSHAAKILEISTRMSMASINN
jgi:hypothetical protein